MRVRLAVVIGKKGNEVEAPLASLGRQAKHENKRQISPEYPFFFFLSGEYPFLTVYRGSTPPFLYRGSTPPPNIRPRCRCRQSTKPYSKSISGEYLPPDKTPLSLPLVHEACAFSKNISGEYPPSRLDPAIATTNVVPGAMPHPVVCHIF